MGLKLGTENNNYTNDIIAYYKLGYFQYIELFVITGSFNDSIEYWKQFSIPIIIHAPHSSAGMNPSLREERINNKKKILETIKFADALNAEFIIFHPGIDGNIEETIEQLFPFADSRLLIENKPLKGLNNEKCLGFLPEDLKFVINELKCGFCLDIGHAICASNSLKIESLDFVKEFFLLNPAVYHLADGDYSSEKDMHLHYGDGNFPIKSLLKMIPEFSRITNEAKHNSYNNLDDFKKDYFYVKSI